ncbi:MAG: GGDEF domain-containing protein [Woeseiaceae bacterium]|nr:GGDEF domain-containing protein [Woeseiaceae bacterium]
METNRPLRVQEAGLLAAGFAVFCFLFDLSQPLGVAGGMPYVALPLLGLLARSPRMIMVTACIGVVLTCAGFWLSPPGAPLHAVLLNRGLSVAMIIIIAAISLRHMAIGERLRESLERQASRDPLTGLYNRRYVFSIVTNELNRYRRYGEPFSLILIDADHFKRVNDEHGHCAGDAALQAIASACTDNVRTTDVVGRFGGEEFIVALPHTTATDAAVVAERIRGHIERSKPQYGDRQIDVTLSLGIADAGAGVDSFDELLKAADVALYAAKRGGRNRVAINDNSNHRTHLVDAA